uniref:Secreted protein n=1 Tax=Arundo donax TaxID=35708 RepID=A0A0A9AYK3_ARUDO
MQACGIAFLSWLHPLLPLLEGFHTSPYLLQPLPLLRSAHCRQITAEIHSQGLEKAFELQVQFSWHQRNHYSPSS